MDRGSLDSWRVTVTSTMDQGMVTLGRWDPGGQVGEGFAAKIWLGNTLLGRATAWPFIARS